LIRTGRNGKLRRQVTVTI